MRLLQLHVCAARADMWTADPANRLCKNCVSKFSKCMLCRVWKHAAQYSRNQWARDRGNQKCADCVQRHHPQGGGNNNNMGNNNNNDDDADDYGNYDSEGMYSSDEEIWQECNTCGRRLCQGHYRASQWGQHEGVCRDCENNLWDSQTDMCLYCRRVKPRNHFSASQWSKNAGNRKCASCVDCCY